MEKTDEVLRELADIMEYNRMPIPRRRKLGYKENEIHNKKMSLARQLTNSELFSDIGSEIKNEVTRQVWDNKLNTKEKLYVFSEISAYSDNLTVLLKELGSGFNELIYLAEHDDLTNEMFSERKERILDNFKSRLQRINLKELETISKFNNDIGNTVSEAMMNNE